MSAQLDRLLLRRKPSMAHMDTVDLGLDVMVEESDYDDEQRDRRSPVMNHPGMRRAMEGSGSVGSSREHSPRTPPGAPSPTMRSMFFRRDLAAFRQIQAWAGDRVVVLVFGKYSSVADHMSADMPFIYAHGYNEINHPVSMLESALNQVSLYPLHSMSVTLYVGRFPAALLANNGVDTFTNLGAGEFPAAAADFLLNEPQDVPVQPSVIASLGSFAHLIHAYGQKTRRIQLGLFADAPDDAARAALMGVVLDLLARLGMPQVATPSYIELGAREHTTVDGPGRVQEFLRRVPRRHFPIFAPAVWRPVPYHGGVDPAQDTDDEGWSSE